MSHFGLESGGAAGHASAEGMNDGPRRECIVADRVAAWSFLLNPVSEISEVQMRRSNSAAQQDGLV